MGNKITAVIVIYEKKLSEIASLKILREALDKKLLKELLIYDNSLETQPDEQFVYPISYIHDASNSGLAIAYNCALELAKKNDSQLLLLLDQDTELPLSYFEKLVNLSLTSDIGACLPLIESEGRQISPVYTDQYISMRSQSVASGLCTKPLMAINSGAALLVQAITDIGGFNQEFPLDYLDHWLFWRLNQSGKNYYVLNQALEHDLSVLDYRHVSFKRYESIIQSETLYYTKYCRERLAMHKKHLRKRVLKQFLTVKNRDIYRRTLVEMRKLKECK
ncbi:glycosyltransferase [Vagococcus sp. BWB3-3]|uniref:Glycosyltransferase n=1 Tax=Vagococcus allomyrinae TaxID=2794353 RepID=A0A940SX41_9ENTE|nr:glycosyltransferase [Vagococcus allomyrinae]MBP1043679.1 glycosyltransferase [Vagococcus allomyrinae]